jgi:hypothetical protein
LENTSMRRMSRTRVRATLAASPAGGSVIRPEANMVGACIDWEVSVLEQRAKWLLGVFTEKIRSRSQDSRVLRRSGMPGMHKSLHEVSKH